MSERLYRTGDDRMIPASEYVPYLRRCAEDWRRIANGTFYGIPRTKPDPEALAQADRVEKIADRIQAKHDSTRN